MKIKLFLLFLLPTILFSQVITWEPVYVTEDDSVIVYFDASEGSKGLMGFTGDVYAHTGVITTESNDGTDWKHAPTWGDNSPKYKLERIDTDLYKFVVSPSIRDYYDLNTGESVLQIAFVFRSADQSKEGKTAEGGDIFLPLRSGLNRIAPANDFQFMELGDFVPIIAVASPDIDSMYLYRNDTLITQTDMDTLKYVFQVNNKGKIDFVINAVQNSQVIDADSFSVVVNKDVVVEELPNDIIEGFNKTSDNSAVLSLFAPNKEFVYLIGDFNNWEVDPGFMMKRTPDDSTYWLELSGLDPAKEYAYQYYVDGEVKIADPYTDKVLDPWNDKYIGDAVYPNLKSYPQSKTNGIVSVFQLDQEEYNWEIENFNKPDQENLVIYEMLVRDFVITHSYKTLIDTLNYFEKLGVNAIELMPVNEFEGNESWGYNPSFYFAPDKYYGTKNDLKKFIDECHKRGIAVIIDMVLNHSYGQSPLVRLYWNSEQNRPSADSPWYNEVSPNQTYSWGYDFNHQSPYTRKFVDRVNKYWIEEFKVDGFRFDFTKGFTNTSGDGWAYDQQRIGILKRMADKIWETDPTNYVILEHLASESEEKVLANYGMMLWGNMNHNYNEATMGYNSGSKSSLSWGVYKERGWSEPNLVTYMESHDEERLMYKNLQYGNSSGNYDITNLNVALQRIKLAAAFFVTLPGPKMIWQFGELGYDYSIDFNGRVGNKPIKWDYYQNENRKHLYDIYSALINLRNEHDVFETEDFNYSLSGATKRINLNDSTMNVTIIGNFDVVSRSIEPKFQHNGTWYDFFAADSMTVLDVNASIELEPGEFHVYLDKKVAFPDKDIILGVDYNDGTLPSEFSLEQNYPNPFNPSTTINFNIVENGDYTLKVFNLLGEEVANLVNGNLNKGVHSIKFNAAGLSSGIYFYSLKGEGFTQTKKMILMK